MKNIIIIVLIIIIIFFSIDKLNAPILFNDTDKLDKIIYNKFDNIENTNNALYYLDGYWVSDPNFNKLSNIDNMILYFDLNKYNGTLLITSNNQITKNEIKLYIDDDNLVKNNFIIEFNCLFNEINNNKFIWSSKNFNAYLDIKNGNLKLYNNKILYANLFKNNLITSYINTIE